MSDKGFLVIVLGTVIAVSVCSYSAGQITADRLIGYLNACTIVATSLTLKSRWWSE